MSQLFDSLSRKRRAARREGSARPTAQGDAVLATLGYSPARTGPARRVLTFAAVVGGLLVAWIGLGALFPDRSPDWTPPVRSSVPGPERPPAEPTVTASALALQPAVTATDAAVPPAVPGPASEPAVTIDTRPAPPAVQDRFDPPPVSAAADRTPPATSGGPGRETARAAAPAPSADGAPSTPASGGDLMNVALYHHRAGDFENALIAYRTLLQQNEMNAAVHNNIGLLYQQKNLLDDAARAFERALLIDARYALAHNNYGVTLLRQGRPDAAVARFRTVLEIDPRNVDAMVNLALAEKDAGRAEQARASLLRALGEAPRHAMAHYNLAVLHDEAGEAARAIEHYRAFLEHAGVDHADRTSSVRARLDALDCCR